MQFMGDQTLRTPVASTRVNGCKRCFCYVGNLPLAQASGDKHQGIATFSCLFQVLVTRTATWWHRKVGKGLKAARRVMHSLHLSPPKFKVQSYCYIIWHCMRLVWTCSKSNLNQFEPCTVSILFQKRGNNHIHPLDFNQPDAVCASWLCIDFCCFFSSVLCSRCKRVLHRLS